ncbi:MAG TPA: redoxin domain-containing protein [Myxococcales bacterium]|nr:redoxin domain-containing protein [Myxococcales bacterium]
MPTAASSEAAPPRSSRINKRVLVAGAAIVLPLIAVLVANLGRDPHMVRSPLVGRPAPPFSLQPVGGGAPVRLESFRGKPLVINFWATWCVPCFEEHPALTAAARGLPDVQFLGVVYEDEEARTQAFLKERSSAYPSVMDPDGRTAIAYGVFGVPETFFIDAEGRIVEKFVGPLQRSTIAELVARARGGRP